MPSRENNRMIESFIRAKERFLKPDGLMYPASGTIFLAPITDEFLYNEQCLKAKFWENSNFFGIDLSPVAEHATSEYLSQAAVGKCHIRFKFRALSHYLLYKMNRFLLHSKSDQ